MDGWNTFSFPFGARPIFFRGENVSFSECNFFTFNSRKVMMLLEHRLLGVNLEPCEQSILVPVSKNIQVLFTSSTPLNPWSTKSSKDSLVIRGDQNKNVPYLPSIIRVTFRFGKVVFLPKKQCNKLQSICRILASGEACANQNCVARSALQTTYPWLEVGMRNGSKALVVACGAKDFDSTFVCTGF